jgi:hypothetical protein
VCGLAVLVVWSKLKTAGAACGVDAGLCHLRRMHSSKQVSTLVGAYVASLPTWLALCANAYKAPLWGERGAVCVVGVLR